MKINPNITKREKLQVLKEILIENTNKDLDSMDNVIVTLSAIEDYLERNPDSSNFELKLQSNDDVLICPKEVKDLEDVSCVTWDKKSLYLDEQSDELIDSLFILTRS